MKFSVFSHKPGIAGCICALGLLWACSKNSSTPTPPPVTPTPTPVTTLTTDVTASGGPDVTYKRGIATGGNGGFIFNDLMKANVDATASVKMQILSGIRNIYKEASLGEFYKENGVYKTNQSSQYTDIRKYARDKGLELMNQIGGTPDNTATPLYPLSLEYLNDDGDYVPLPTEGTSMTEFQKNFVEWALNADKELGANYHSIWIAHQEPSHTLGFINKVENDAAKRLNIRRFIDYWKPIASQLRAAGCKVGGIQLPSGANSFYQYSVDYLKQQNVQLDFLTFQFYEWGDQADFDIAVAALNSYNQQYPGTKIIVDRGHWYKLCCNSNQNEAITTSKGMLWYLKAEKFYMDKADLMYAHLYDNQFQNLDNMQFKIHTWLNGGMPVKRRPLTGLPAGMEGFVLADNTKLYAAVWSTTAQAQPFSLKLTNASYPSTATLSVKKASGTAFTDISNSVTWNSTDKTIQKFTIGANEIVLISLQ